MKLLLSLARRPVDDHVWATLALAGIVALHFLGLLPYQDALRTLTFNLYQIALPRERASAPALIVDIDERSLRTYGQWPWPRSLVANLVDRIAIQQPSAVGLDILMPEADRSSPCNAVHYIPRVDPALEARVCSLPDNDAMLAEALTRARAVLGAAGRDGPGDGTIYASPVRTVGGDVEHHVRHFTSMLGSLPVLQGAAAGHALLSTDVHYGVVETIPLIGAVGGTLLPALSVDMLRIALGATTVTAIADRHGMVGVGLPGVLVPTQDDGTLWIRYGHHDGSRFISAADVLDGRVAKDAFARKLVLVGSSGLGLVDLQTSALGERMPGAEIHAQVLENIFDGTTLQRPRWAPAAEGAMMFLVGCLMIWGFVRLRVATLVPLMLALVGVIWVAALAAFHWHNWLIDAMSPSTMTIVVFGYIQGSLLLRSDRERDRLEEDLRVRREQAAMIKGEMEAAKRIQLGILPSTAVLGGDARVDVGARMDPARMVGGDLYDFFMVDDRHLLFLIGDVCGKGVPASLFMAISKTVCKSLALRGGSAGVDPGELLRQANIEISRDNPESLFVTVFLGVLDLDSGQLRFANAGHEAPSTVVPGGQPVALACRRGPPLGMVDDFPYVSLDHRLMPGEFLVTCTDGVIEAHDRDGGFFGPGRLAAVLARVEPAWSAADLVTALCAEVEAFAAGADPADDVTVLALRVTARA